MRVRRRLSWYLAGVWAMLAVYASLYPFAGWRDTGGDPLAFLFGAWPRYFTGFDIATNVAAYLPLGFFLCVAIRRWLSLPLAVLAAVLAGTLLSGALEFLQNYLPTRVPSNLDLVCNVGGALLGAVAAARWGNMVLEYSRLQSFRDRIFSPRRGTDSGLILLGFWLLAQLDPSLISFGTGDLRRVLELPAAQPFSAERFREIEALIAATGLLAAFMIAGLLAAPRQRRVLPIVVFGLVVGVKTFAYALLHGPVHAFVWATPGTLAGIGIALVVGFATARLLESLQRAFAALSILAATAMVNLAPHNPYLDHTLQVWNPGQFLSFHGATLFVAAAWPFIALPWLMLISTEDK